MTAMLKRLFEQPGTFDKDGWLTIGVCGEQKELEILICQLLVFIYVRWVFFPWDFRQILLFGVIRKNLGQV